MKHPLPDLTGVLAIQSELEAINLKITSTQSIHELIDLGGVLAAWMAFTGEQMARAKATWRLKTAEYVRLGVCLTNVEGEPINSASVINKYIASLGGEEEADYEFIERVNRSCTHCLDFLRSAISALKEEQKQYNQNF
jgi:hypothetical protein